jgi:hypothetical protein
MVVGSFDQEAFLEPDAGADEGDQVGCVDGAPPGDRKHSVPVHACSLGIGQRNRNR